MTIEVDAEIDAPLAAVWAIVSDFANLQRWHPEVRSCAASGAGPGAVRTVVLPSGRFQEKLERCEALRHQLGYAVVASDQSSMLGLRAVIELSALGSERTQIRWSAEIGAGVPDRAAFEARMRAYYESRIQHLRDAVRTSVGAAVEAEGAKQGEAC
jgi:carbon monoxide dehydrogenase subunit G